MPSYQFGDAENFSMEIPKGDYLFEVLSEEWGTMAKGKCAGADTVDVKVLLRDKEGKKVGQLTSALIFHEVCFWVLDCFLKSSDYRVNGRAPQKGESLEINHGDLTGLRGWCHVDSEPGINDPQKRFSKVKAWLTDREKLTRVTPPVKSDAPAEEEAQF